MGSALLYKGPGPLGDLAEEYVWSEYVTDVLSSRKLAQLAYPTSSNAVVEAKHIIEHITVPYLPFLRREVYATILNHLQRTAVAEGQQFIDFAYDWRASLATSAEKLIRRVVDITSSNPIPSVALVSHSMGGLVCRLALSSSAELRGQVRRLVHIATPLHGVIKAYRTLKDSPALNPPIDDVFRWLSVIRDMYYAHLRQPRFSDMLMQVIRSFPSVYELLPPADVQVLVTETGEARSCVDKSVWQESFHDLVIQARSVHDRLAAAANLDIPMLVVYSAAYETDLTYRIRGGASSVFDIRNVASTARGDKTVTADSAVYRCPAEARYRETRLPYEHVSLCRNYRTLQMIDRYLFGK